MYRRSSEARQLTTIVRASALLLLLATEAVARAETFLDLVDLVDTAEVVRPTRSLPIAGDASMGHLVSGWGPAEEWGKGGTKARWIEGAEAVVSVDTMVPRARRIRIHASPLSWAAAPRPQAIDLLVDGVLAGSGNLPQGAWSWIEIETPPGAWRVGTNLLTLRPAWSVSPKELGGSDPRTLSAAVAEIQIVDRIGGNVAPTAKPGDAPPAPLRNGATLVLVGEGAIRSYLWVPPDATLSLELAKASGSPVGDGFRVEVLAETDGAPSRRLLSRAFPGLTKGGVTTHQLDLAAFGGRVTAITLRLTAGDDGREKGDVLEVRRATVEVPVLDDALRRAQRTASARYLPPVPSSSAPPPSSAPSALVYLMDALRAGDLSCNGEPNPTSPHIDRLSRRGALMGSSFSQAPNTPPSVKALLTGRYLPSTGHGRLPEEAQTVAELLAGRSYCTAAFSNSPFVGANLGTAQGFETLDEGLYVRGEAYDLAPPPKDYAERIAAAFATWLGGIGTEPFFVYVHTIHPHNPYTPLPPFDRLFTAPGIHGKYDGTTQTLLDVEHGRLAADPGMVAGYHRLLYQEDIAYGDHALGKLLAALQAKGRLEETIVTVIADHGEEFLEHGGVLHGYTAFDEMLQVPLVMAGGGIPAGRIVTSTTQSIDVAPTILDLCGVDVPPAMEGRSLRGTVAGEAEPQTETFASGSSAPGIYSIRTERSKYVFAPRREGSWGGRMQGVGSSIGRKRELSYLYDLEADPLEQANLVEEMPVLARFFHQRLMSWLRAVDDGTKDSDQPDCMPVELCQQLVALGYVQAGECLCECDRFKHVWEQHRLGTLRGRDAKLLAEQLECCAPCRALYEAYVREKGGTPPATPVPSPTPTAMPTPSPAPSEAPAPPA